MEVTTRLEASLKQDSAPEALIPTRPQVYEIPTDTQTNSGFLAKKVF